MLSDHFYHATIRRTIAAFGSIFNDIKVVRKDGDGQVRQITRVPLAYGPKQKFLARVTGDSKLSNEAIVAIKLPRMSFEITSLEYDPQSKIGKMNKLRRGSITDGSQQIVYTNSPYKIGISLSILAKNQDDALQVVEQILPYFQPEYTITINEIPEIGVKGDIPIVLTGVNLTDDYEGDYLTRRAIIYTLDFSTRVRFYGPIQDKNVILTSSVDINNLETFGFIEEATAEAAANTDLTNQTLVDAYDDVSEGIDETDDNAIT
jgi:hypothetical protein